jgi:hypothetical protein
MAPSSPFGRSQLLFLVILWVAVVGAFAQALPGMAHRGIFFVHTTFWITGGICSLIVMTLSDKLHTVESQLAPSDNFWKPGPRSWTVWLLIPILIILLAYLTVSSHTKPLHGSHLRFTESEQAN